MATDRKTLRWLRGAAASALTALTLVVLAQSPAYAEGEVAISFNPPSVAVEIGGQNALSTVALTGTNPAATYDVAVSTRLDGLSGIADYEVGPGAGCQQSGDRGLHCTINPGGQATFQVQVSPAQESNLAEGQTMPGTLSVDVQSRDDTTHQQGHSAGALGVTVTGGKSKDGVPAVKGKVTNGADSKPISGVKIQLTDGEEGKFTATTGDDGSYKIEGTSDKPIKPGDMTIKATKDGYDDVTRPLKGVNGTEASMTFSMSKTVEATTGAPSATQNNTEAPVTVADDSGWSSGTWILVILGVLFVGGGITAIVLLLRRGKHDEDDDDLFADKPPAHTPKAAQTGLPGVYDAGPRRPVMEAPTMIHNGPLLDDDDLARYGSGATSPGFGPAYGDGQADQQRTQMFEAPRDGAAGQPTQMFEAPRDAGYRQPGYPERDDRGYGPPEQQPRGGYDDRPYSSPPAQGGYGQPDDRPYSSPPASERPYSSPPATDRPYSSPPASERPYSSPPATDRPYSPPPAQGGYGQPDDRYGPPADQRGYGQPDRGYGPPPPASPPPPPRPSQPSYDQRGYEPPAPQSYEQDPRYDNRRPPEPDRYDDPRYGPPAPPPPSPADPRDGYDERYDDRPRW